MEKNYHPDGFAPMRLPEQKWSDDVKAIERGLQFFHELKESKTVTVKPMSYAQAEELIAKHVGLTFAAIRAVETLHGIV